MCAYLLKVDKVIRQFLKENASHFRLVEEGLKALALLETGKDSDIRAEAISSFLGVLSLYKDVGELNLAFPVAVSQASSTKSPNVLIFRLALTLRIIQNLEVLIEMITVKKLGQDNKCATLFLVELSKAIIRLTIYLQREESFYSKLFESLQVATYSECICGRKQPRLGLKRWHYYCGERSGRRIYRLSSLREQKSCKSMEEIFDIVSESRSNMEQRWVLQYLCPLCSKELNVESSSTSSSRLLSVHTDEESARQLMNYIGETLSIFRPALHVLLAWKYGWRSWKPWCLALVCELASSHLLSSYIRSNQDAQTKELSTEVMNRRIALLYYLIRSPLFDVLLESKITKARERTRQVFVLATGSI
ncbi:uncharacterized protein Gasu_44070 [Galdieria sulphuraria]|uniref:Peroxisomal membrane protein PEX16 n=1 Tax=Galdieria sulphuraria TaxID=130081 RepID=M2WVQ7_GALSU|nr:uncharacterized protein Gasu_44070 [Galdieria sulphuraria]EME28070.1 hypothetical protein Gasu_44070 [Galdieria sulphuraria]|eukprot:XP_005704590.1 hypothetical protein Gasu_44070 [Galdieria sulphuraria]